MPSRASDGILIASPLSCRVSVMRSVGDYLDFARLYHFHFHLGFKNFLMKAVGEGSEDSTRET